MQHWQLEIIVSVKSAPETCVQCDTTNTGENNCGHANIAVSAVCESPLACFTQIYEGNFWNKSLKVFNARLNFPADKENVVPGWYTKRGCLDNATPCAGEFCASCDDSSNCNNKVFPSNRNKCLKCQDSDCSSPRSEYCDVYLPSSQDCVTLFDGGLNRVTVTRQIHVCKRLQKEKFF